MALQQYKNLILVWMAVFVIAFRILPFFIPFQFHYEAFETPLFKVITEWTSGDRVLNLWFSSAIMLITALLSWTILNRLWAFESGNSLPLLLMALLLSSGGQFQWVTPVVFFPIFLLLIFLALFNGENQQLTPLRIFNVALLIALGSLFNFSILLLLPMVLVLLVYKREIRFKLVLAMLSGLATVYWVLTGVLYIVDQFQLFGAFFRPITFNWFNWSELSDGYLLYLGGLTVLVLIAFFNFTREYVKMKQNHRVLFLSSNFLAVYVLLLAILGWVHLLDALAASLISFTLIFSFYFIHGRKRSVWIFFPMLLLLMLTSFIEKF